MSFSSSDCRGRNRAPVSLTASYTSTKAEEMVSLLRKLHGLDAWNFQINHFINSQLGCIPELVSRTHVIPQVCEIILSFLCSLIPRNISQTSKLVEMCQYSFECNSFKIRWKCRGQVIEHRHECVKFGFSHIIFNPHKWFWYEGRRRGKLGRNFQGTTQMNGKCFQSSSYKFPIALYS